jgi:hypothetical protein
MARSLLIHCERSVQFRGIVGYEGGRGGKSVVLPRDPFSLHSFANDSTLFGSAAWRVIRIFHSCGDYGGVLSLS